MRRGFTFIEILIVVSITALLATVGLISYIQINKQARDAKRKTDIENIRQALEMYRSSNGVYPTTLSDLTSPTTYIQRIPTDPKDPTYTYTYTPANNSYTLGAYTESATTGVQPSTCLLSCGAQTCNYCVTPYGQQ